MTEVTPPVEDTKVLPPVNAADAVPPKHTDPPVTADPPKQEDEPPVDDKAKELDTTVWGDTGDEIGNSVLQVLQDSGVTPDTAKALLYDAVKAGDPSKIDRDKLVEAVGKANANLILAGVDNFVTKQQTKVQEVLTVLHEEVGGKAQWETMVTWANANLAADEIADYIAMVDQGGRKARMAAKDMRERYEAAGNTSLGKDETVVANGKPTTKTTQPLSRTAYYEELNKLSRTGKLTDAANTELWARRAAGKQQGI